MGPFPSPFVGVAKEYMDPRIKCEDDNREERMTRVGYKKGGAPKPPPAVKYPVAATGLGRYWTWPSGACCAGGTYGTKAGRAASSA